LKGEETLNIKMADCSSFDKLDKRILSIQQLSKMFSSNYLEASALHVNCARVTENSVNFNELRDQTSILKLLLLKIKKGGGITSNEKT